jgi:hypothetical protein
MDQNVQSLRHKSKHKLITDDTVWVEERGKAKNDRLLD